MDSIAEEPNCIIKTKEGPVRGYISNRGHYKFKSIPYAKPPVGDLRFLPPHPVTPWTEVLDATKNAPLPFYRETLTDELSVSEDCLYLQLSTPSLKPQKPMPVMFWIGSLAYQFCLDELFDVSMINNENIIIVRCGFRIGPLGLLSINDVMAPGNCGLKDVVMALKWVQNNIAEFGGDPHNVTIFGSGCGGAMVHLFMLSPMATGLFHKAIIQSASALNNWSLAQNPLQAVMDLAKILGITKTYSVEIIEELKAIPAVDIMEAWNKMEKQDELECDGDSIDAIFKPCIEQDFEGQAAFLTRSPPLIIKSGNFNKVPLIIGSNNFEIALMQLFKCDFYNYEKFNKNLEFMVPKSLAGESNVAKQIARQLLDFYLDGEEYFRKEHRNQYVQMMSDYYFLYYIHKTVLLHSQFAPKSPIYYYMVSHAGEWYVPDNLQFFNSLGHAAELPFIFGLRDRESNIFKGSKDSIKTRAKVVKMWTNFAKFGNPTPINDDPLLQIKWDPVEGNEKINYLSIGPDLTKGRNPFKERMDFWDQLHQEHTFLRMCVFFKDIGIRRRSEPKHLLR